MGPWTAEYGPCPAGTGKTDKRHTNATNVTSCAQWEELSKCRASLGYYVYYR